MAGEVATVHGGHILWLERAKIRCAIPVVEVPAEQFHVAQGLKRSLETVHGFCRTQPAEVPRTNGGKKVEPDIGWRSSMSDNGFWRFLKIVGRKRMVPL